MTVNYEIKGMLAKLLATEDIIVECQNVQTASFNVKTRVLTLPIWEASDTVVDLLVAHEVGHSRETPSEDWSKGTRKIPAHFMNVVEDARVEKKMKRRYQGLAKTFINGYKELFDQDFFKIGDKDVGKYNLADRANLYFKIGHLIDIPIKQGEESDIVKKIADSETFNDVMHVSELLYNYCKREINQSPTPSQSEFDFSQITVGVQYIDDSNQQDVDSESKAENVDQEKIDKLPLNDDSKSEFDENQEKSDKDSGESDQDFDKEPEVETMNSYEESLEKLLNTSGIRSNYLELPQDLDLQKLIIPNSEIHSYCEKFWKSNANPENFQKYSSISEQNFNEFKRSAQKEVNYLVKEFECRKSADSYSRTMVSNTGVLDCNQLHTYKYNDDLFKRISITPDGKNHGLIFVLDWSGSMSKTLLPTIKQLYNLIWFCRKVSIPFDVYAFSDGYVKKDTSDRYEIKDNVIEINPDFYMLNILTSKVNNSVLNQQLKNIFRIAEFFNPKYLSGLPFDIARQLIPRKLFLHSTPLNEAIISLHKIIPDFKNRNKLQKVHCIILTDGESNESCYHKKNNDVNLFGKHSIRHYTYPNYIRDRKTGATYLLDFSKSPTDVFLRNIRDNFPDVNFIGIRLLEGGYISHVINSYLNRSELSTALSYWSKNKTFTLSNSGYHSYFFIHSSILSNVVKTTDTKEESKSEIKYSFMKSLNVKKMNKKILNDFINLII